jgi:hypothetical protein
MNQLVSQQAGGALVFKGTVSEPASVTVGGKPATVTVDNRFEGQAEVPEGTGQVDIVATDPSRNVRTSTYDDGPLHPRGHERTRSGRGESPSPRAVLEETAAPMKRTCGDTADV